MSLFNPPGPNKIEGWVCIAERGTVLDAEMEANVLRNLEIPVHVFSKRDTAYSLSVGEMSSVYLYVPQEFEEEARKALNDHG